MKSHEYYMMLAAMCYVGWMVTLDNGTILFLDMLIFAFLALVLDRKKDHERHD